MQSFLRGLFESSVRCMLMVVHLYFLGQLGSVFFW